MDKVVFDTVVFVRGLINPHSICGRLVFEHADRYRLVLSQPIIVEILEVLRRPELTRKFKTLDGLDMSAVLAVLAEAEVVNVSDIPAIGRDPKDDKFLVTTAVPGAAYLVSEDKDLLDISEYEGVQIVRAATFIAVLEEKERENG